MKKLVSLVLVLMMACMMIPAMAETATETLVGEWYLVDVAGMNPADMGISMTIILNEDGTAVCAVVQGEETLDQEGTWEADGDKVTITISGDAQAFDLVDGTLQADMGGGAIGTFSKDATATAEAIEIAEVNLDAQPEDFNGNWACTLMSAMGMTINIESAIAMGQFSEVPTLTFQDGKVAVTGGSLDQLFGEEGFDLTYADGIYSYSVEIGESAMGFYVSLLQDGMMELKVSMGDQDIGLYFTKAE